MIRISIAGLARHGGVGVETVRLYQCRGLLATPSRAGGIGRYGTEDIRRLLFIRAAQAAGFTLDEIGQLLSHDATQDRARAKRLAYERLAALDRKIADLQKARTALQRLARACDAPGVGPCPILAAFESHG
ncbi:MerR family DNA-binding protein [Sphingomonas sp. AR_OL41]|uniref:MerR family DNA-binding protein n=1 Tax=Sphingomonas sp. AR_OL41 TaxID=3042729 RepID=UPI00248140D5|nr:MerR family DNA-binding protein [Sphingomonas sp. AR_OL41]MDH7974189.1 MerR family DNA-binding protein [Sphingomonas sp. AR_OL41]